MNIWLKPDWDRGYEKGREAGLAEAEQRIFTAVTALLTEYVTDGKLGVNDTRRIQGIIKGEK